MKRYQGWLRRLGVRIPLRRGRDGRTPGSSVGPASLEPEIERLKARIDSVTERVARLGEEVLHVDGQIERIRIVESALERVEADAARQLAYIQELRSWEHRLAALREVVDEFVAHRDAIREVVEKLSATRPTGAEREAAGVGEDGVDVARGEAERPLDAVSERVHHLAADLARKETALERALERLDRVELLATRAAITVRELEDQNARLIAALERAEAQTGKVDILVRDLEHRTDELKSLANRGVRFEERLNSRAAEVHELLSNKIEAAEAMLRALRAEHDRLAWASGAARDASIHVVK